MKIYLDICCYGRPFDDLAQPQIKAEAVAVKAAVAMCRKFGDVIVGGFNGGEEMGAVAIDLNDTAEVITRGRRVLVDALGADGARAFVNSCANERDVRPRITDAEIAEITAQAEAEIAALRPYGSGDITAEKQDWAEPSQEELSARIRKREAEKDAIRREHPEYTLQEILREQGKRELERRGIAYPA
jgi:hypothetical protein